MKGLYGQLMAVTSAVLVVAVGISLWVLYTFGVAGTIATTRSAAVADIAAAAQAAAQQYRTGQGMRTPAMRRRERSLGGVLAIVTPAGATLFAIPAHHPLSQANEHLPVGRETRRIRLRDGVVWASARVPGEPLDVVWRAPLKSPTFPTPTEDGVMISGLAAIVLAQILWALVARRLTTPLEALVRQLERYGQGDFGAQPAIRAPEEFMRIAAAVTRMGEALRAEREAREAFLAEVAHDLRTPLTAMRSLLGSLGRESDPSVARDRLGRAEREAERLTRLVNDLLDLARHETGHLSISLGRVDLREIAALGAVSGEAAAEARGLAFDVDVPEEAVMVRADLDRGAQIVVNLIDNAVRYTPPGGRVAVRVRREGTVGALWVEDTGPGFEPGAADWAWSAFTRGKAARENDGGTGLGLAVGRALAEVMEGELAILAPANGFGGRVRLALGLWPPSGPRAGARQP